MKKGLTGFYGNKHRFQGFKVQGACKEACKQAKPQLVDLCPHVYLAFYKSLEPSSREWASGKDFGDRLSPQHGREQRNHQRLHVAVWYIPRAQCASHLIPLLWRPSIYYMATWTLSIAFGASLRLFEDTEGYH